MASCQKDSLGVARQLEKCVINLATLAIDCCFFPYHFHPHCTSGKQLVEELWVEGKPRKLSNIERTIE
jgi:hypothetical protein